MFSEWSPVNGAGCKFTSRECHLSKQLLGRTGCGISEKSESAKLPLNELLDSRLCQVESGGCGLWKIDIFSGRMPQKGQTSFGMKQSSVWRRVFFFSFPFSVLLCVSFSMYFFFFFGLLFCFGWCVLFSLVGWRSKMERLQWGLKDAYGMSLIVMGSLLLTLTVSSLRTGATISSFTPPPPALYPAQLTLSPCLVTYSGTHASAMAPATQPGHSKIRRDRS